ncbi:hypothetical protein F2Q69_00020512 [Brassica cretica]|uniref:Uncharacterized protein n=1 Tax=Brassica cretica TaxID=69181 RepID=A0A8S9QEZ8_BRACR|nr:hypothetical protein F2Q69_00020512 [Brassica cretica]
MLRSELVRRWSLKSGMSRMVMSKLNDKPEEIELLHQDHPRTKWEHRRVRHWLYRLIAGAPIIVLLYWEMMTSVSRISLLGDSNRFHHFKDSCCSCNYW